MWHWQDPRIQPQQKMQWEREKDRTYRAVLHAGSGKLVPLAALDLPDVEVPGNAAVALGTSALPYLRETTWDEGYRDVYIVSLADGSRTLVTSRLGGQGRRFRPTAGPSSTSRQGVAPVRLPDEGRAQRHRRPRSARFDDELHDTPDTPPAYGFGGWVDDGAALLVYDRFDIWHVPARAASPGQPDRRRRARGGRSRSAWSRRTRRTPGIRSGEPRAADRVPRPREELGLLHGQSWEARRRTAPGRAEAVPVRREGEAAPTRLSTPARATAEFPDLWVARRFLRDSRARSRTSNPQIAEFAWGTAELVDYTSLDGMPLQGVLIKPANYQPGTALPGHHLLLRAAVAAAPRVERAGGQPPAVVRRLRGRRLRGLPSGHRLRGGASRAVDPEVPGAGRAEAGGHGHRRPEGARPARPLVGRLRHGVSRHADERCSRRPSPARRLPT